MQMILDKYPENKSGYLLPIIRNTGLNERCTFLNTGYNINHSLKRIAVMVGVTIPLTLYVARHSWASPSRSSPKAWATTARPLPSSTSTPLLSIAPTS